MEISHQDLTQIVAQATSLSDRLAIALVREQSQTDINVKAELEQWCEAAAKGNPEKFAQRLAWDGLDLDFVRSALGVTSERVSLPAWATTLQAVMLYSCQSGEVLDRCLDSEQPLPFEEVCLPFMRVARQQLGKCAGAHYHLLSTQAHATLERSLLGRLCRIAGSTLQAEFSTFRPFPGSSRLYYQDFVQKLLSDRLLSFFQKYSVLARLMSTVTDFWIDSISEFLHRFATDISEIEQTFGSELGQVTTLRYPLSDPHNGGRTTLALTFASGLKLVYKPKSLGMEAAYFQFLDWLNHQGARLPLKTLKLIDRSTYGWVEYVEHQPCADAGAAQRYYQRAGMLLCLVYGLGGTDCICENLIASGEQPVLIDLEMLMHHPFQVFHEPPDAAKSAPALLLQQLTDSVLQTGLLPRWEYGLNQQSYDVSGFGGGAQQAGPYRMPTWRNINTDRMELVYETVQIPPTANFPILSGVRLSANDYVEELVDGFQQMYSFLSKQRELILAADGPLAAFAGQPVRFVFRDTKIYGALLTKTLKPKFMQDGVARSIQLDVLSRGLLVGDRKPDLWQLLKAEIQALEQLDVPYFTTTAASDSLPLNGADFVPHCFTVSGYKQAFTRLQCFSKADMTQQVGIIRASLYSKVATSTADSSAFILSQPLNSIALLSSDQLINQAIAIARELQQQAVRAPDGSATWVSITYIPKVQKFQFLPIRDSLYDGRCGVALFLAALAKVTKESQFRDLALAALQPLCTTLRTLTTSSGQQIAHQIGIGGASGLGSILYTLVRIAQFVDEPALLEDAQKASEFIDSRLIAADTQLDVIGGAAGAILGLLSLYRAGRTKLLEQAIACGQHLLTRRTASQVGFRSWTTTNFGKLLTGFSHGASGIAYALLRLYEVTDQAEFLDAATEAIAYERRVFSTDAGNWPDFMTQKPSFRTSWCHGAPGIGLTRLGGLTILDTKEIRQEIATAIQTTQQFGLQRIDHLCCGNFGRAEFLLIASQKLGRSDLWEIAQRQAACCVERANQTGGFQLFPNLPPDAYSPGFFQGTAGIGYELLRLAQPENLPSVLLWE